MKNEAESHKPTRIRVSIIKEPVDSVKLVQTVKHVIVELVELVEPVELVELEEPVRMEAKYHSLRPSCNKVMNNMMNIL